MSFSLDLYVLVSFEFVFKLNALNVSVNNSIFVFSSCFDRRLLQLIACRVVVMAEVVVVMFAGYDVAVDCLVACIVDDVVCWVVDMIAVNVILVQEDLAVAEVFHDSHLACRLAFDCCYYHYFSFFKICII